jgi:hypothetical protein
VPEDDARRDLVDVEEVELAAELAMVALLGLLEHVQIALQLVLGRPRRAVDALQHLVLRVAAPVRAGNLHQLEVPELARARHVRTAAQVLERAFAVERDVLAGGNRADDLGLVGLAHRVEMRDRLVARQDPARHRLVLLREIGHLRLDRRQVLGRERALVGEVVIEAVLDDRPDRHLGVGEQLLHRIREQVRGRVSDQLEPIGILVGDDRELLVVLDAKAGVDDAARLAFADAAAERRLGEPGPIDAATSSTVTGPGNSRREPSGNWIEIM